ncbi:MULTISPECIES: LysM peptidoglycan-binding domain-containing protein [unclassified Mycolicibacterium]|uniref:LysM peptidoglycan-binding domain-containing protein n=1 Tax=unclassified Mycolicibacterium TaxID=2636767 RepID=UPI0012DDA383|nr:MULTISPECIES: LysM peptidoglycan-binding domain-containing protein [unclassified Mycolicibacterium]MUL80289.1 LysM peptidoglycan-binding domain-containing protein [Mycolicibacterium sp. CBMA 329]MUL86056.1 LysM peptidoglycan-binding domain-containing protein [Mycolicibacterium sp. CBMA 331]MUM00830.1 LysM peptidoglycan-binding domain-containing protein [Mycolicibacterium sp. CBMA 334]MUM26158.1 LysM peptidoglycan-binding domain-containing protein [Mycolicibacterium sp. CBMA 295]MUM36352.1 L
MAIIDIPADSRSRAVRAMPQSQPQRAGARDGASTRASATFGTGVARPVRRVRRPAPVRPTRGAVRYRGTGVLMSRASHRSRPVTPLTTVLLAVVAAGITVWLGLVAQFGGVMGTETPTPTELAVVQVKSGETLQQVARRVAPGAPVSRVVEQIRDLNQLESAAIDAGQTLLAPVG